MRETLRVWTENLETFALEVIFEQRQGWREELLRKLLFLLSKVFQLGVKLRLWLYNARILELA